MTEHERIKELERRIKEFERLATWMVWHAYISDRRYAQLMAIDPADVDNVINEIKNTIPDIEEKPHGKNR